MAILRELYVMLLDAMTVKLHYEIIVNDKGICVKDVRFFFSRSVFANWDEIDKITAFNLESWASWMVCLAIEKNNQKVIHIDNKMYGWKGLLDAIPKHLPGCNDIKKCINIVDSPDTSLRETIYDKRI